jgi:hypothetical protein
VDLAQKGNEDSLDPIEEKPLAMDVERNEGEYQMSLNGYSATIAMKTLIAC